MEHPVRCPSCGFLQEDANFCRECGASLEFATREVPPASEPIPYPWGLFAIFLLATLVLAVVLSTAGLRPEYIQRGGVALVLASVVWVVLDASRRRVPRPWIWCLSVWLFWLICFPWYLKRREHPERSCVLDSPRNRREAVMVAVTAGVLTFFLLALARFVASHTKP